MSDSSSHGSGSARGRNQRGNGKGRSPGAGSRSGDGRTPRRDGASGGADRQPWKKRDDAAGGKKLWTSGGRPARGDRDAYSAERALSEEEKLARELRSVRPRHEAPEIPAGVTARDLDKVARNELKTLSKENAEEVARHLVMAARLIDDEPALAHQHALSAERRAGRIAIVRETLAITAYAIGDFALAIRELRTYRRISGSNDELPLMVDSERGVGRPDRALEAGRSVDRTTLPVDVQVSLAIAMSGARLDLGQPDAALAELEIPQLTPDRAFSYSPDLFYAYAEVLDELGRDTDAALWRERAKRAEFALDDAEGAGHDETIEVVEEDYAEDRAESEAETETGSEPETDSKKEQDGAAAQED